METLSAVSLVGTIVQFVHFGCSLVSKSTEIYRSGSGQTQDTVELDLISKNLSLLWAEVQNKLPGLDQSSPVAELARASKKVADELAVLISKIRKRMDMLGNGEASARP